MATIWYWLTLTMAYIFTSWAASFRAMKYVGWSEMFSSSGNVAVYFICWTWPWALSMAEYSLAPATR